MKRNTHCPYCNAPTPYPWSMYYACGRGHPNAWNTIIATLACLACCISLATLAVLTFYDSSSPLATVFGCTIGSVTATVFAVALTARYRPRPPLCRNTKKRNTQ